MKAKDILQLNFIYNDKKNKQKTIHNITLRKGNLIGCDEKSISYNFFGLFRHFLNGNIVQISNNSRIRHR
jgi:hypothetical protein